jgi:hypothetical protein
MALLHAFLVAWLLARMHLHWGSEAHNSFRWIPLRARGMSRGFVPRAGWLLPHLSDANQNALRRQGRGFQINTSRISHDLSMIDNQQCIWWDTHVGAIRSGTLGLDIRSNSAGCGKTIRKMQDDALEMRHSQFKPPRKLPADECAVGLVNSHLNLRHDFAKPQCGKYSSITIRSYR